MSQLMIEASSLASVTPASFKTAMRRIASTVNVITSGCDGILNGMTATAVCSVSAEPPSVLIVVNQDNRSHALIERSGAYTVNVLSASQQALAEHFASSPLAPFANVPHALGRNKCPIIDHCTSYLECVVASTMRSGTHSVFIGRVVGSGESDRLPLIYHDGRFRG
jgi:flavin reductase (DIM6/NTAB) family NADH-FMN oxidoreductase RutF